MLHVSSFSKKFIKPVRQSSLRWLFFTLRHKFQPLGQKSTTDTFFMLNCSHGGRTSGRKIGSMGL